MLPRYATFRVSGVRPRLTQRSPALHVTHYLHSTSTPKPIVPRIRRVRLGALALTGALSSSVYLCLQQPTQTVSTSDQTPLTSLIRTCIVYSLCSIPWLVDYSPTILSALTSVPGLKMITEAVVRVTFFSQFVGGESALETVPVLTQLRAENKGAILNYSVEVDEDEVSRNSETKNPAHKQIVEEIIRCIDVAADFDDQRAVKLGRQSGRKTWVAVKLTALVPDAKTFINFSKHLNNARPQSSRPIPFPGVPRPTDLEVLNTNLVDIPTSPLLVDNDDIVTLRELRDDLYRICRKAKERGVTIIIDAEHRWYQPAIEAFQLALMREFNRLPTKSSRNQDVELVQPLVYGTFQAYLRRTPQQLEQAIQDAQEGGYALGVKLVRGAYHQLETSSHNRFRNYSDSQSSSSSSSSSISPDELPPVWQTKAETDACFNSCARVLIKQLADDVKEKNRRGMSTPPRLGLLFGTHNAGSCELVLDTLVEEGLAVRVRGEDGNKLVRISEDVRGRVCVGQLYGMSDTLSTSLTQRTSSSSQDSSSEPFVLKYVPYGNLTQVMPYLSRRAIENKSVLGGEGGAREERKRIAREIVWRVREVLSFGQVN
ncbi:FAD-linked oxidoreductase [Fomitiporia mediterranea MF3/22]|uniref:FAD-linked oxidoreductase n=1 Tax=Fomitiporia mediterranea (strain MF3/22) TaxID=694068 RepID=UPI0004409710|nr:FAD-linked oxidoreductase [Fomitiporia mediterranea MF3/22]EJD04554.1 FAD-linked oxidoreductase [Fomitiporia mediterranea MF3/22]